MKGSVPKLIQRQDRHYTFGEHREICAQDSRGRALHCVDSSKQLRQSQVLFGIESLQWTCYDAIISQRRDSITILMKSSKRTHLYMCTTSRNRPLIQMYNISQQATYIDVQYLATGHFTLVNKTIENARTALSSTSFLFMIVRTQSQLDPYFRKLEERGPRKNWRGAPFIRIKLISLVVMVMI